MITIIIAIIISFNPLKDIEVVEITSNIVNIRTSNSADSKVICQAQKGETFRYIETTDDWYKIDMYSGNYRYLHKSTANITNKTDEFSLTDSQVKRFINEIAKIEDRATQDSGNWNYTTKFIDLERELDDCYKLKFFREQKIATHLYLAITAYAFKNNLLW